MKKILSIILAFIMITAIFSSCASGTNEIPNGSDEETIESALNETDIGSEETIDSALNETDIGTEETDTIAKGGSVISCRHNAWTDSFHTISHELIKYVGDDLVYPWIDSLHETDDDSVLNSVNVYSFIKEFNIPRDVYDELITYSTSYYL